MPSIIDYQRVLDQMRDFKCHYHNSGAFGFPQSKTTQPQTIAWIGPDDPTIRPEARSVTRQVAKPYEQHLSRLLVAIWRQQLSGPVWLMPMSHWAFELTHGNPDWLPALIQDIGLDPKLLQMLNNAAAIEFAPADSALFSNFIQQLLVRLRASDFTIAFPGKPILCMLHHHTQLWWTTTDPQLANALGRVL